MQVHSVTNARLSVHKQTTSKSAPTEKPAKPGLQKPASKKAGGPATTAAAPADDDDSALGGNSLSERDAREQLMAFLGEETFQGLQVDWICKKSN